MDNNKTILYCVLIVCSTFLVGLGMHIFTKKDGSIYTTSSKFTHCLQIIMSESRQSGKVIDANQAKEICLNVDKSNIVKK